MSEKLRTAGRLEASLDSIEKVLLVLLSTIILFLILLQVVSRYLYGGLKAISWTEELARMTLVWLTLLGSAHLSRRGEHLETDILTKRLKGKKLAGIRLCSNLTMLLVILVLLKDGIPIAEASLSQLTPTLEWPSLVLYGPFILFFALMGIWILLEAVNNVRRLCGKQ